MAIPSLSIQHMPVRNQAVRFQGDDSKKLNFDPEQLIEALEALKQQRGQERKTYIDDPVKRDEIVWNLENNKAMSALMKDLLTKCFSENISSERRSHLADIVASKDPLTEEQANRVVRAIDRLSQEGSGKGLTDEQNTHLMKTLTGKSLTIAQRDQLIQVLSKDELSQEETGNAVSELTKDRDKAVDEYHLNRISLSGNRPHRHVGGLVKHKAHQGGKFLLGMLGKGIDMLLPDEEAPQPASPEAAKKTEKPEKKD